VCSLFFFGKAMSSFDSLHTVSTQPANHYRSLDIDLPAADRQSVPEPLDVSVCWAYRRAARKAPSACGPSLMCQERKAQTLVQTEQLMRLVIPIIAVACSNLALPAIALGQASDEDVGAACACGAMAMAVIALAIVGVAAIVGLVVFLIMRQKKQ
jgi:hypothetical protein